MSKHLGDGYYATRYITDRHAWPPQQSKHFTTLAFIYHKNEYTQNDVITLATVTGKGQIDDAVDVLNNPDVLEDDEDFFLKGSGKVTKSISEWLALLRNAESSHPNTILIQGAPGMGKSFLLKHIAYLWAKNELLTSSQLLFLIHLRNPAVQNMSTIDDLVNQVCNTCTKAVSLNSKEICAYLYQTRGEKVTILLDGLDEFPEKLLDDDTLITKLLENRELPACNIVVSSRPHASKYIRDNVRLRVDILGFTEEDRESFIKQSLKDQDKSADKLLQHLHDHPIINSLCYVPFIMTVLLYLYKQGHNLFKSSAAAELYKQFVCHTIKSHLANLDIFVEEINLSSLPSACSNIITNLSKLSLESLSKNKIVFSLDEVKQACPGIGITPGGINGFGLLQAIDYHDISSTAVSINFIHFSIQEFLAAHYVANLSPDKEMRVLKNYFWSKSHWNMFSLYCGLTKGQHSSFKKFLSEDGNEPGIAKKFLEKQEMCLHLYQCFYEAGDEQTCRMIAGAEVFTNKIIRLSSPLLPTDITTLSLFLSSSHIKHWKILQLLSCNIRDEGCRIFHHAIVSSTTPVIESSTTPVIENISLSSNLLSSASARYISDIVIACKTTVLHLNGNNLQKADALSNMLEKTAIEELYIHGNNLNTSTANSIFGALKKQSCQLKILGLTHNNIQDEASDEIADTLQVNKSLLALWLNSNPLSEKAVLKIVQSLHHNNTLQVLILPNNYLIKTTKHIQKEITKINSNRKENLNIPELDIDFL